SLFLVAQNVADDTLTCLTGKGAEVHKWEALSRITKTGLVEEGADIVKVFPGEILGPAFVKAILGPLPHAPLMPTEGVALDNARTGFTRAALGLVSAAT